MQRSKRSLVAKDTLEILEKGFYTNPLGKEINISTIQKKAEENTILYRPQELLQLIEHQEKTKNNPPTQFIVNSLSTLDAVREEFLNDQHLVCLNFASARNPGGGFLNGSQAQEESIARSTGLYNCQLKAEDYYTINRQTTSCLYTDHIIYSPNVPVFKDDDGNLLPDLVYTSIITAPAVNAGAVTKNEPHNIPQIEPIMKRRMEMVLAICKAHQHKTLVLGAWGCGVFQNDPKVIAKMFQELLFKKFENQFERVIFSIYSKDEAFIRPFQDCFL